MKRTDLIKFIEDEVNQVVKSEKSKSSKTQKKQAPKELNEEDFDEVMFKKINESINRNNIENLSLDNLRGLIKKVLSESTSVKKNYEIYHGSFSDACSEAIEYAKEKGYEINEDDWFRKVSVGPKKPEEGKTNKYSIELLKGGKTQKEMLHFQVYRMESRKYELNAYIN
jgi:hypothetical protein